MIFSSPHNQSPRLQMAEEQNKRTMNHRNGKNMGEYALYTVYCAVHSAMYNNNQPQMIIRVASSVVTGNWLHIKPIAVII